MTVCAHRVSHIRRPGELFADMTHHPDALDSLIELLLESRPRSERWLTVSFDDGYRDSVQYILSRAPRYPNVEWLLFVCPEKTERQVGFRWDAAELQRRTQPDLSTRRFIFGPVDVATENQRADLREAASRPEFTLASIEECRAVQALPNGGLGNHTNLHLKQTLLYPAQAEADYRRSTAIFERLFGPQRHFAFPFGTPDESFHAAHVELLRELTPSVLWTTENRPYDPAERVAGALLPRFPLHGDRRPEEEAFLIGLHGLRWRARKQTRGSAAQLAG